MTLSSFKVLFLYYVVGLRRSTINLRTIVNLVYLQIGYFLNMKLLLTATMRIRFEPSKHRDSVMFCGNTERKLIVTNQGLLKHQCYKVRNQGPISCKGNSSERFNVKTIRQLRYVIS